MVKRARRGCRAQGRLARALRSVPPATDYGEVWEHKPDGRALCALTLRLAAITAPGAPNSGES